MEDMSFLDAFELDDVFIGFHHKLPKVICKSTVEQMEQRLIFREKGKQKWREIFTPV